MTRCSSFCKFAVFVPKPDPLHNTTRSSRGEQGRLTSVVIQYIIYTESSDNEISLTGYLLQEDKSLKVPDPVEKLVINGIISK